MERPPHGAPWSSPDAEQPPIYGVRHRPTRPALHLFLALATLGTLLLAGGTFWEPADPPLQFVDELLRPERLWAACVAGRWYALWAFLILGAHEMGHYFACRRYGIPATLPYFLPGIPMIGTFGAVIRIRGPIPNRRALFDIAAAGPIAGFLVTVPVLIYGVMNAQPFIPPPGLGSTETMSLGEPVLLVLLQKVLGGPGEMAANGWIGAGWVGLLVTSLNLFPVGQLDGGHAVYALSRRAHRTLARWTPLALFGVVLFQLIVERQFPVYVVWLGILLWMRDRHPRLLDEETPLGPGRKFVAAVLVVMFVVSFILVPLSVG